MSYRFYKGEEYYGRNIHHIGQHVVWCTECGYIGTVDTLEEREKLVEAHDSKHQERRSSMKVLMIGTKTCTKCKSILPRLSHLCEENGIEYEYTHIDDVSKEVMTILLDNQVKQVPAFIIYKGEDKLLVTGDDIFMELESI